MSVHPMDFKPINQCIFPGHSNMDLEKINGLTLEKLIDLKKRLLINIFETNFSACQGNSGHLRLTPNASSEMANDQILLDAVNIKIKQLMKAQLKQ